MTHPTGTALVIVLEGDPGSAGALAALLADWGYDCVHGESFDAVADAIARRAVEVRAMISDFQLHDGATGLDAVARLAALGVAAPALVLTGALPRRVRRGSAGAGCQVMEKPVAPRRLKAWLERVADLSR